ncbi:hypothetical protein BDB00DRAFT_808776 [Zychaea mexicana]|uniref:uncharacterized protein n=1 Tax=Zychaea mexicana TaxID=64656 RepID=UPI0022FDDD21|nr:uncharacterized protein BDB00DRAFT_808776 [Zychaea mexicana]KAI9496415.1 hypothetical protein BDB00DRAFT_808776 [Zychaea mexicana]
MFTLVWHCGNATYICCQVHRKHSFIIRPTMHWNVFAGWINFVSETTALFNSYRSNGDIWGKLTFYFTQIPTPANMDSNSLTEQPAEQKPDKDMNQLAQQLRARLQYARFKVQTGMANQSLEQMENTVERRLSNLESINSNTSGNKQGIDPMDQDGFPPTPPRTQPRSSRSEREEEERAARNLMMISSSPGRAPSPPPSKSDTKRQRGRKKQSQKQQQQQDIATTPSSASRQQQQLTNAYYNSPTLPSFQDVVARVPDYDRKSRQFAESMHSPPVGALPVDPGSISTRFPYFPPVNWTGALSPVDNSTHRSRTPPSPGYRYAKSRQRQQEQRH